VSRTTGPLAVYLGGGENGVGMFNVYKHEFDGGTKDEGVAYDARIDIMEDHGPSVCLVVEGLEFSR